MYFTIYTKFKNILEVQEILNKEKTTIFGRKSILSGHASSNASWNMLLFISYSSFTNSSDAECHLQRYLKRSSKKFASFES